MNHRRRVRLRGGAFSGALRGARRVFRREAFRLESAPFPAERPAPHAHLRGDHGASVALVPLSREHALHARLQEGRRVHLRARTRERALRSLGGAPLARRLGFFPRRLPRRSPGFRPGERRPHLLVDAGNQIRLRRARRSVSRRSLIKMRRRTRCRTRIVSRVVPLRPPQRATEARAGGPVRRRVDRLSGTRPALRGGKTRAQRRRRRRGVQRARRARAGRRASARAAREKRRGRARRQGGDFCADHQLLRRLQRRHHGAERRGGIGAVRRTPAKKRARVAA